MPLPDAHRRANAKYAKAQENVQGYVKALIRVDMEKSRGYFEGGE